MQTQKTGAELIAAERQRQITAEGYTPEHDDKHTLQEMADAAVCYALLPPEWRDMHKEPKSLWPWERSAWRPEPDAVRNLVKAGALIAAEIDRLQRSRIAEASNGEKLSDGSGRGARGKREGRCSARDVRCSAGLGTRG